MENLEWRLFRWSLKSKVDERFRADRLLHCSKSLTDNRRRFFADIKEENWKFNQLICSEDTMS